MNSAKITKEELAVFKLLAEKSADVIDNGFACMRDIGMIKDLADRAKRICYIRSAEIKINRKKKPCGRRIFEEVIPECIEGVSVVE